MSNEYVRTGKAAKMLGRSKVKIIQLFKSGKLAGYVDVTNSHARTKVFMVSVRSIERYIAERENRK